MTTSREDLSRWIFGTDDARRFTQDSPVRPDVWFAYGEAPDATADVLLTPHAKSTAAELAAALAQSLGADRERARLAYSESYVVAELRFDELIRCVLPLSSWWHTHLWPAPRARDLGAWTERQSELLIDVVLPVDEPRRRSGEHSQLAWFVGLVGRIEAGRTGAMGETGEDATDDYLRTSGTEGRRWLLEQGARLLKGAGRDQERAQRPALWSVSLNRHARTAVWRSVPAVKADAVERVFETSCADIRWAIIDSGVDAAHPAFRRREKGGKARRVAFSADGSTANSRVVATYDFTRLRDIVAGNHAGGDVPPGLGREELEQIETRLRNGRALDWDILGPMLRVPHDRTYRAPTHEHGTHVAGILGADWRMTDGEEMPAPNDIVGVCPDVEIYDLRVFDDSGHGDEFSISAALQFVRHLNAHSDLQVIHGVNLSLSLDHRVENFAVGRTPVCDECERLIGAGVCVVTVAGNEGRATYTTPAGLAEGYRTVSITDPGNAQKVITVGATHRYAPHMYGVSYFSSRGPTGDGRAKPDLVAPGEKINAPVPDGGYKEKDGTSQAAPHVSGAAALLMARNEELRGQPDRIKEILCSSATDLGRERYFQGAGMLDTLRAMQEV